MVSQNGRFPGAHSRAVLVLVLPGVHALDFGGPVQAIHEANEFGADYRVGFVSEHREVRAAQGFTLGNLEPLPRIRGDEWIVVPGTESSELDTLSVPVKWLHSAGEAGARLSSICSGAFALSRAGLLEGLRCTTHWKVIQRLREWTPTAQVLENRLFVRDGNVITSAGLSSGIDMTLALIQEDYGARVAGQVARVLVLHMRREADSTQQSIFLRYRVHTHDGVHRVQDWIVAHPDRKATLNDLANVAALSPRHLTRVFRRSTGITLKSYTNRVRLEVAHNLLHSELTIAQIAEQCGFADARQLRRLWRHEFGRSLRDERAQSVHTNHVVKEEP